MGATYSTGRGRARESLFSGARYVSTVGKKPRLLQRAGFGTQAKCQAKPPIVDSRGWALTKIYGVPYSKLGMYPPTVYSLAMAEADIAACSAGRDLPYYDKVVRYDKISRGQDPRVYALTKYHGYTWADLADGQVLRLLPYSDKNAQIDISSYTRTGRPYYKVIKATSVVMDPKRGIVRDWRNKGFKDGYRYDQYDPRAERQEVGRLGDPVRRRFDLSKYRSEIRGGRKTYFIPCSEMPIMCRPGDREFPWLGDGSNTYGQTRNDVSRRAAGGNGNARRNATPGERNRKYWGKNSRGKWQRKTAPIKGEIIPSGGDHPQFVLNMFKQQQTPKQYPLPPRNVMNALKNQPVAVSAAQLAQAQAQAAQWMAQGMPKAQAAAAMPQLLAAAAAAPPQVQAQAAVAAAAAASAQRPRNRQGPSIRNLRNAKRRRKQNLAEHAKQMGQLKAQRKGLDYKSNAHKNLTKRRVNLQTALRARWSA